MAKNQQLFVDSAEKELGNLRARAEYLDPNKDYFVLTGKRLYHRGQQISLAGGVSKGKCETVINVQNISATFFSARRRFALFIIGLICAIAAVAVGVATKIDFTQTNPLNYVVYALGGFALLFFILFIFARIKVFSVIYSGGTLSVLANNCSIKTMREFTWKIHAAIDEAREVKAPAPVAEVAPVVEAPVVVAEAPAAPAEEAAPVEEAAPAEETVEEEKPVETAEEQA